MNDNIYSQTVRITRVYTDEGKVDINKMIEMLKDREDVVGVTVFRGIAGFGPHHHVHQASLIDLSAHLPLVIELFHAASKTDALIEMLHSMAGQAHIVSWDASLSREHIG